MLCGGNLDPHFPKRGDCVKRLNTTGLDYLQMFISVPLNQSKTMDLQILRKIMLLLIHQPLLKVALKMKTFSLNTIMKFIR